MAGMIEARGVGIVKLGRDQLVARAPVVLLVDLVPPERIERLPETAAGNPAGRRLAGAEPRALRGLRLCEVASCLDANRGRMIDVASAMPDSPASATPIALAAIHDTRRPFVVVTGLCGAGRITALHALEDLGYVAVDNVPLPLLGDLMRSTAGNPGEMAAPLAFGVDTRTYGFDPHELVRRLHSCASVPTSAARLLFLECETETLQRRYTESRRPHPMAPDRPVVDGIVEERRQIGWMRDSADVVIDTSALSPHEFKQILAGHFALGRSPGTRLSVMSFSYRRGLPREADLVFDVRFLKNPHYEPS